jgi:hypothetical protein
MHSYATQSSTFLDKRSDCHLGIFILYLLSCMKNASHSSISETWSLEYNITNGLKYEMYLYIYLLEAVNPEFEVSALTSTFQRHRMYTILTATV